MSTSKRSTKKPSQADASNTTEPGAVKDPNEWKTGDEPATAAQLSYLRTLSQDAGETFDESEQLTKSEASKRIDALREKSPRVQETK